MNTIPRTASEQKLIADHPVVLMVGHKGSDKSLRDADMLSMREIQHRAETMTSLLKAILDFRPPPHWK